MISGEAIHSVHLSGASPSFSGTLISSLDVAMNQKCADELYATLQEYIADGGDITSTVEWISDKGRAKEEIIFFRFS